VEREKIERAIITAVKDQVSCDLEGEAVILNFNTGVYYGLNEVGARVWALIQQPTPFRDVLQTVSSEYEVSPQACASDLLTLIRELAAAKLIHVKLKAAA
jgi:hypothetical protein